MLITQVSLWQVAALTLLSDLSSLHPRCQPPKKKFVFGLSFSWEWSSTTIVLLVHRLLSRQDSDRISDISTIVFVVRCICMHGAWDISTLVFINKSIYSVNH
ncbi:hypothetical protein L1987_51810 [Smallanthus sonchifolius]|uniref:Uncharacterized protein n=1 Tax=Smallanthus sonchifolius TaxID=185202 RepID=A0ACB9ESH7_9ASTR|nr:hypothetical protein L1987_51810 [Smallanthus sonchifolius]